MSDKAPQAVVDVEDVVDTTAPAAIAPNTETPKRRGRPPGGGNGQPRKPRAAKTTVPEHRVIKGDTNVRLCITTITEAGQITLDRQVALPKCEDVLDATKENVTQFYREWAAQVK